MLAIAMNGQPLPVEHGFPVRMVVPGLYGYVSATKWLVDLEVTTFDKFSAFWTQRGWSAKGPVKTQSRIDVPRNGATVKAGSVRIGGSAWAQHTGIEKVEYQLDGADVGGGRARPRAGSGHVGAVGRHRRRGARASTASSCAPPTGRATPRPRPRPTWFPTAPPDGTPSRSTRSSLLPTGRSQTMAEQVASRRGVLFGALLSGAGVAVSLGVYGRVHARRGLRRRCRRSASPARATFKAWATTVVVVLAVGQVIDGAVALRQAPGRPVRAALARDRRTALSGALAFVLTLPVAAYCLYGFGFAPSPSDPRRWSTPSPGAPSTARSRPRCCSCTPAGCRAGRCPLAGGLLFTSIVVAWLTSAVWLFSEVGIRS